MLRITSAPPNGTWPVLTILGGGGIAAWNVVPDPLVHHHLTETAKWPFLGSLCRGGGWGAKEDGVQGFFGRRAVQGHIPSRTAPVLVQGA